MNITQNELILGVLLVIAIVYIVFHHSSVVHDEGFINQQAIQPRGPAKVEVRSYCIRKKCGKGQCILQNGACGCISTNGRMCVA